MLSREEVFDEWKKTLDELEQARMELARLNAEIPRAKDALDAIEAEVYLMVSSMKDESGKPTYTNETQRQKATLLRLSQNEAWMTTHRLLRDYERRKEQLIAKISNLKDRIEYFKYLVGGGE